MRDPKNIKFKEYYDNTVDDLQEKIVIKREEYKTFDEIIVYLYDYVFQNNIEQLRNQRRLIRVFLHYMYHNCDIGKEK